MSIKDIEGVLSSLDSQLGWRRREISMIKINVLGSSGLTQALHIRSGIALLYAHWEGFIKNAAKIYLAHVASQKSRCIDLSPNFIAMSTWKEMNEAFQAKRPRLRVKLVHYFLNRLHEEANISTGNSYFDTSNLNYDCLADISILLGIDHGKYETKKHLIDESLLSNRNKIAHGEYLEFEEDRFIELADEVLLLIDLFKEDILEAATRRAYLTSSSPPTYVAERQ